MFSRKIILFLMYFTITSYCGLQAHTTILPPNPNPWADVGAAIGNGISRGIEQGKQIEMQRQQFSWLERERQKMTQVDLYRSVVNALSCTPNHQTIRLSEIESQCVTNLGELDFTDNSKMGYIFKRKLERVLANGSLVEWVWSMELSNHNKRKFFTSGKMDLIGSRVEVRLLDSDGFPLSTCAIYADICLRVDECTSLQGKWVIPYDQIPKISSYKIKIN